jgi:hypothetical protein
MRWCSDGWIVVAIALLCALATACSDFEETRAFLGNLKSPMWEPHELGEYNALINAEKIDSIRNRSGYFVKYPYSDNQPMGYIGTTENPRDGKPKGYGKLFIPGCTRSGSLFVVYWEFGRFRTVFVYPQTDYYIAGGAQTFAKNGTLLAEARVRLESIDKDSFVIEEQHYDRAGATVFWATNRFSHFDGSKKGTLKKFGKQQDHYYSAWPLCYTCQQNPFLGQC